MMDMMIMHFHQRVREHVLFKEWFPTNDTQFVISCVGVAFLGLLFELLKTLRLYLYRRADETEAKKGCCDADIIRSATSYEAISIPSSEVICECLGGEQSRATLASSFRPYSPKNLSNLDHQIQSVLFFVQVFFSYSLMLIAMTYNTALFLSLIAGHTVGFFFTQCLFLPTEKLRVGDCCCS